MVHVAVGFNGALHRPRGVAPWVKCLCPACAIFSTNSIRLSWDNSSASTYAGSCHTLCLPIPSLCTKKKNDATIKLLRLKPRWSLNQRVSVSKVIVLRLKTKCLLLSWLLRTRELLKQRPWKHFHYFIKLLGDFEIKKQNELILLIRFFLLDTFQVSNYNDNPKQFFTQWKKYF